VDDLCRHSSLLTLDTPGTYRDGENSWSGAAANIQLLASTVLDGNIRLHTPVWPYQRQSKLSWTCMHTACIPTHISVTSVTVTLKCVVYFVLSQTVQWTSSCWHVRHCEKCIYVLITTWEVLLLFMEIVTTVCHVLLWLLWWKSMSLNTQEVLWHLLYISHSFLYNHAHTTRTPEKFCGASVTHLVIC
jgi:hypothetical protein